MTFALGEDQHQGRLVSNRIAARGACKRRDNCTSEPIDLWSWCWIKTPFPSVFKCVNFEIRKSKSVKAIERLELPTLALDTLSSLGAFLTRGVTVSTGSAARSASRNRHAEAEIRWLCSWTRLPTRVAKRRRQTARRGIMMPYAWPTEAASCMKH